MKNLDFSAGNFPILGLPFDSGKGKMHDVRTRSRLKQNFKDHEETKKSSRLKAEMRMF